MMPVATRNRQKPEIGDFVLVCDPETNYTASVGDLGEVVGKVRDYLFVTTPNEYTGSFERHLFNPKSLRTIGERVILENRFPVPDCRARLQQQYAMLKALYVG